MSSWPLRRGSISCVLFCIFSVMTHEPTVHAYTFMYSITPPAMTHESGVGGTPYHPWSEVLLGDGNTKQQTCICWGRLTRGIQLSL